jgi:hypothetical protein
MHNQPMNRRQFMRASAGTAALGLSSETEGLGTEGGLGSVPDHKSTLGDVPVLTEDYQVIQRDGNNKGACLIRIPSDQKDQKESAFHLRVVDQAGRIWMDEESHVRGTGPQEKDVLIENIPTGGPYTLAGC